MCVQRGEMGKRVGTGKKKEKEKKKKKDVSKGTSNEERETSEVTLACGRSLTSKPAPHP